MPLAVLLLSAKPVTLTCIINIEQAIKIHVYGAIASFKVFLHMLRKTLLLLKLLEMIF